MQGQTYWEKVIALRKELLDKIEKFYQEHRKDKEHKVHECIQVIDGRLCYKIEENSSSNLDCMLLDDLDLLELAYLLEDRLGQEERT